MSSSKSFQPGQIVYIRTLKKRAEIVEASGVKAFKVRLGMVCMRCPLEDLEAEAGEGATTRPKESRVTVTVSTGDSRPVMREVDLHGLRVQEAICQLEDAINQAILQRADRIDVIHGLGSGKVLNAVNKALSELSVVVSFQRDTINPGKTRVFLTQRY